MKLLEYQAKEFFSKVGIPVPKGIVCKSAKEARTAFEELGGRVVLKAQALVGGRGRAGGIKFPSSSIEASEFADKLLSNPLKGAEVSAVLAEERIDVEKEFYLGVVTDTDAACPLLMISPQGGVEIEELAASSPDLIKKVHVDPRYGLLGYKVRLALNDAGISREIHNQLIDLAQKLYKLYWDLDAELAEINPLVLTKEGKLIAADAKLSVDDSALFRQPDLPRPEPRTIEERAKQLGLSYVLLDGDIGIMSNGAGLTMATMDYVELAGGKPANFLDCGQRIIENGVWDGLNIILENPNVRAILINIFGGGVLCDVIAGKIVQAVERLEEASKLRVNVVACVQGRNMEEGRRILSQCKAKRLRQAFSVQEAVELALKAACSQSLRLGSVSCGAYLKS